MANQLVESVEYKLQISGQQAASKAVANLQAEQEALNKSFDRLGPVAQSGVKLVRTQLVSLDKQIDDNVESVDKLRFSLTRLGNTDATPKMDRVSSSVSKGGNPLDSGGLGSFFSAAGGLNTLDGSGITQGLQELGQFADTIQYIGQLGGKVAPIAAAATIALTGAVALFSAENEKASRSLELLNASQAEYFKLVTNGTREQVEAARDALALEVEAQRARIDERKAVVSQFQANANVVQSLAANLANVGGVKTFRDDTAKLEEELGNAEYQLSRYNSALQNNVTAARDAANAEAAKNSADVGSIQARTANQLQFLRDSTTITGEQLAQKIGDLSLQEAALTAQLNELYAARTAEADAAAEQVVAQLTALESSRQQYLAITGLVAARDQEREAVERLAEAEKIRAKEAEDIAAGLAKLTTAQEDYADAQQSHADAVTRIASDLQEREREIIQDAQRRAAEMGEEFGISAERAAEDVRRELAKLNRSYLSSVGDRDALAAMEAEEALQDAETEADIEARRRQEDYDLRLRQQAAAAAKELEAARNAAKKQLDLEVQKYNETIEVRRREVEAAQQAYNALLLLQQQRIVQETGIYQMLNNMVSQFAFNVTTAYNQLQSLFSGALPTGSSSTINQQQPTPFASGGPFAAGTTALVGERGREIVHFDRPGRVYNHQQTEDMLAGSGGGLSAVFNINGAGQTKQQVIATVDQRLDQHLTAAGWE